MNIIADINQFHPSLRVAADKEIAFLDRTYPVFGKNKVTITVSKTVESYPCLSEKKAQDDLMSGYGLTRMDGMSGEHTIYMNGFVYGVDGDIAKLHAMLQKDHRSKFHGEMVDPMFSVAHEYGHVIEGMMIHTFGKDTIDDPNNAVLDAHDILLDKAREATPKSLIEGLLFLSGEISFDQLSDAKKGNKLVSRYAYENPNEFFAETFAALCYGDEKMKSLPTVKEMRNFLSVLYSEAAKLETVQ